MGEGHASIQKFLEHALQCRPSDPLAFAINFFHNEQLPNRTLANALYCLPYLLHDNSKFRECVSTVFWNEARANAAAEGSKPGTISVESTRGIALLLLNNHAELVSILLSSLGKQKYLVYDEFESLLRLCVACVHLRNKTESCIAAFRRFQQGSIVENTEDVLPVQSFIQFMSQLEMKLSEGEIYIRSDSHDDMCSIDLVQRSIGEAIGRHSVDYGDANINAKALVAATVKVYLLDAMKCL